MKILLKIIALSRNFIEIYCHRNVQYIPFDLNKLNCNLFDKKLEADCLIHLAWENLKDYKNHLTNQQNQLSSFMFIKSAIYAGIKHISVAGTCLEYGLQNGCLSEETIPTPSTPYGIAKNNLRINLESLQNEIPFNLNWFRLFYLFDARSRQNSLFGQLQKAIDQNSPFFPMSGGEQIRDFIPIELAAKMFVEIACNKPGSGIINVCSGNPIKVKDAVNEYIQTIKTTIKPLLGNHPYPDYEPMEFWGCTKKLNMLYEK